MFKFNLGQHVRDVVNGFEGFIVSRAEYVTGCRQYGVESPNERTEGSQLHRWIDEIRLRATPCAAVAFDEPAAIAPGGPVSHPPPR